MIQKLQPRDMLHPTLIAKKLHELIDKVDKIEDKLNDIDKRSRIGQTDPQRSKETVKTDDPGSDRPVALANMETKSVEN